MRILRYVTVRCGAVCVYAPTESLFCSYGYSGCATYRYVRNQKTQEKIVSRKEGGSSEKGGWRWWKREEGERHEVEGEGGDSEKGGYENLLRDRVLHFRQTDKQTDRQLNRQRRTHTHTHTHTEIDEI